ncbi:uncharacterized protein BXZ73DRAFT_48479, partial [Epithele typhae]|uniref:uncharacterized protein n=1 Tax=Epithele typhae TaxID=378194 RepID=UPI0020083671
IFTRNRPATQAEPSQLFRALQEIEVPHEAPPTPRSAGTGAALRAVRVRVWVVLMSGSGPGCSVDAKRAPVVVLSLGADVELTFWQEASTLPGARPASNSDFATTYPKEDGTPYDAEGLLIEELVVQTEFPAAAVPKVDSKTKGKPKQLEEVLMVTLYHGDMLVVEGGLFEYSMKKAGMSISKCIEP